MALTINPVRSSRDRARFIRVPWSVYRDDPCWVPPLYLNRRQHLHPRHPVFQHLEWQGWIACRDGRSVGRISAQIDHLNDDQGRPEVGYFGMLDAVDDADVFDEMFRVAEDWLSERGKTRIVGPFNLSINQDVGLLVDGFDTPPYFMMPHGRPYYPAHVVRSGYRGAADLLAYEIDPDIEIPAVMRTVQDRLGRRVSIRPLDRKHIDRDLEIMRRIFNDAWARNWGFVPFTAREFQAIGREVMLVVDDDFISIAEYQGEPAAFIVLLPNLNEAIRDLGGRLLPFGWLKLLWRLKVRYPRTGRVPLMGVRRAYQHTWLGPGLAFAMIEAARVASLRRQMERVELSWILESNQGVRRIIEAIGGSVTKRYRMYEKSLV